MTIQEAVEEVKDRLRKQLPPSELAEVHVWAGRSPCFPGTDCVCYFADRLSLVERVERIMAWKWPKEYGAVYQFERAKQGAASP